jgi:hypothetical protein
MFVVFIRDGGLEKGVWRQKKELRIEILEKEI